MWLSAIPKHALEPAMSMVYKENIFFKYSIKKTLQLYTVFYLGYQQGQGENNIKFRPLSNKEESRLRHAEGPAQFHLNFPVHKLHAKT